MIYMCIYICIYIYKYIRVHAHTQAADRATAGGEVGGWGRVPFSRNFMSPTPRRKWYLTTGRRAH